jgi:hypothetical protein
MIDPQRSTPPQHLLALDFSDLKVGDGVVVIGRFDSTSETMNGLALITDFGRFEATPESPSHAVSWTLESPELDIP